MANPSEAATPSMVREVLGLVGANGRGMELFARELLGSTDAASLEECAAAAVADEVRAGFAALERRERGQHRISLRPSGLIEDGVVLEIVNDDMPFLLDSIMGEVQARGLDARLVMHPIFKVDRTDDGALVAVTGRPDMSWGDGRQESYIVVHIAPGRGGQMSESRQDELAAAIGSILGEVRSVVGDWRPMLVRLGQAIEELAEAPVRVSREVLTEQLAFLGWLVEGNFTFPGLRDFLLDGPLESGNLVSAEDAGLGLLADPDVHVLRRESKLVALTPEVRQFLASPDPIIIAKANVTSRVHRRAHMDYIGIKHYGPGGEVTGELRIVGLFTSSAYTQSPRNIPILRRKTQSLMAELNVPADSHAGKVLANVIDTFPRDELFQIDGEDLAVWVRGILDLDLRPRVRVFVRFDPFDRFASTLVYLPRDRFSTAVRARIGEYLAEAFGGYIAAFYPQFAEGPLVRVHYIVARRAGELPHLAARDLEAGVIGIVRTWSDELDDALARLTRAGKPITGLYARAFPAGYVDAFPPERAIEDIARIERPTTRGQSGSTCTAATAAARHACGPRSTASTGRSACPSGCH